MEQLRHRVRAHRLSTRDSRMEEPWVCEREKKARPTINRIASYNVIMENHLTDNVNKKSELCCLKIYMRLFFAMHVVKRQTSAMQTKKICLIGMKLGKNIFGFVQVAVRNRHMTHVNLG